MEPSGRKGGTQIARDSKALVRPVHGPPLQKRENQSGVAQLNDWDTAGVSIILKSILSPRKREILF